MFPWDCQCVSLFDPLDRKILLTEMEEIKGEPIIPQTLFLSGYLNSFGVTLRGVDPPTFCTKGGGSIHYTNPLENPYLH